MAKQTILVLVDIEHSDGAEKLLRYAWEAYGGNDIHVAFVLPFGFYNYIEPYIPEDSQKAAADQAKSELLNLMKRSEVSNATPHVLRGGVGEQVLLLADKISASLIVLNAVRSDSHLSTLGTNAAQIARHAACSVLLHRI